MNVRIDPTVGQAHPGARAMLQLQKAVNESGLEPSLLELVKIRASQRSAPSSRRRRSCP